MAGLSMTVGAFCVGHISGGGGAWHGLQGEGVGVQVDIVSQFNAVPDL